MQEFDPLVLKNLYTPPLNSHKGQNGKLLIIGGSHLFHGASLWALKVASRIVDMVFYSSVPENNELVQKAKEEFRDGIVIPRSQIENYIDESDVILLGPGMVRAKREQVLSIKYKVSSIEEINQIEDGGVQTYYLTKYLLNKFSRKKWVIDAGALQMMETDWLKKLNGNVVVTPHFKEFRELFNIKNEKLNIKNTDSHFAEASRDKQKLKIEDQVKQKTQQFNCVILLKGQSDIVCSPTQSVEIKGGNAGMTKGGTGDVLAGLVAALSCKNDLFLAAESASYINKKAGESLFTKVGPYFNSSDLADEIPKVMKKLIL